MPEIVRDAWPEDVGRVVGRDEMLGCEVVLGRGDGAPRVVPTPRAVLPFRGTSVAGAAARMAVCTAAVAGTGNGVGSSEAAEPSKICSKPAARRYLARTGNWPPKITLENCLRSNKVFFAHLLSL